MEYENDSEREEKELSEKERLEKERIEQLKNVSNRTDDEIEDIDNQIGKGWKIEARLSSREAEQMTKSKQDTHKSKSQENNVQRDVYADVAEYQSQLAVERQNELTQIIASEDFQEKIEVLKNTTNEEAFEQIKTGDIGELRTQIDNALEVEIDNSTKEVLQEFKDHFDLKDAEQQRLDNSEQTLDELSKRIEQLEQNLNGYLNEDSHFDRKDFSFLKLDDVDKFNELKTQANELEVLRELTDDKPEFSEQIENSEKQVEEESRLALIEKIVKEAEEKAKEQSIKSQDESEQNGHIQS